MVNMWFWTLSLPYFFSKTMAINPCKHCKLLYRKLIYPCCIYLIHQHGDNILESLIQTEGLCLPLPWHIHDWGHNSQIPVISPRESRENGVTSNYCSTNCRGKSKLMPWTLESKVRTHTHTHTRTRDEQSETTLISALIEYWKTHSPANLEVIYGLNREIGLAGGCWLSAPPNINWHRCRKQGKQESAFWIIDLFSVVQKLKWGRWCAPLPHEEPSGHRVHTFSFRTIKMLLGCVVKWMPLSFFLHSSLWEAWWFGGWRVSQQCIALFHPGAVQSSCPIKQAASPGPLPQASSQRLFLHHLFSVTHLQLNCGGCCIPPITTSYTSP